MHEFSAWHTCESDGSLDAKQIVLIPPGLAARLTVASLLQLWEEGWGDERGWNRGQRHRLRGRPGCDSTCGCSTTAPIGMVGIGYWRSSNGIEQGFASLRTVLLYVQVSLSLSPRDPAGVWSPGDGGGIDRFERDVPHTERFDKESHRFYPLRYGEFVSATRPKSSRSTWSNVCAAFRVFFFFFFFVYPRTP